MDKQFLGAILDPRPAIKKAQDWKHEEAASAAPVVFVEKPISQATFYSKRNQAYSSSCMAQSGAKVLGVEDARLTPPYIDLSALPIYRARSNYPTPGMYQQDLFSLLTKPYACKESSLPSQGMSEGQMNDYAGNLTPDQLAEATALKGDSYVTFTTIDIFQIASVIAQNKAVHLMFFFSGPDWWKPVPTLDNPALQNDASALRHGVVATAFLINNNERCLVIEDSAGNEYSIGGNGQRIITESFLKARCFAAGYIIKNPPVTQQKPSYHFTRSLSFGLMNDIDVKNLQAMLKYEGFFPTGIDITGNMLQITCGALLKWQLAHGITDFAGVADVRVVRFGPKSIAVANSLYA